MTHTNDTAQRPIGIFDLTSECTLRCKHCYFYTDISDIPEDLAEDEFLHRLRRTKDAYGIRSAFWIGGEPLLKPDLLRRAMDVFPRNAVATSGALPIPLDLDAGLLVSIEGPRDIHDALRGRGAYDTAMENIKHLPEKSFALATTLTTLSVDAISSFPDLVASTRALGMLVGFHVGRPDDPARLDNQQRDRAVDTLLELRASHPGVLLHSENALELFRSSHRRDISKRCIYRESAHAFDVHFAIKEPCTFAENASCDACGCPVVMIHAAWQDGDPASGELLHALFPKRQTASVA
ncbi:MAG: radical SAM protein [Candidatus Latescibacterota bacterium]|nr:MAG: radical SAM protein [Candidatus Latescibacterota bacterium]